MPLQIVVTAFLISRSFAPTDNHNTMITVIFVTRLLLGIPFFTIFASKENNYENREAKQGTHQA